MHAPTDCALLDGLLELHEHADPASMLPAALELLLSVVGAARGFVELDDESDGSSRRWQASNVADDVAEQLRSRISRGVVAEALATGRTVRTTSALHDPRFSTRESVKLNKLEAVLCAPIVGERVRGVVYVEGRLSPGPFTVDDETRAERLARIVAARGDALCDRRDRDRAPAAPAIPGVVARSAAMVELLQRLRVCAGIDVLVLLSGPSGTGKTLLARALHDLSSRASGPFVELNCASIPEGLFESELFGAARGAHSAVVQGGVDGKIAAAEGGTLFLDEIAELPLGAQAKLLQFLQSRTYYRLGDPRPRSSDARIVVASNADLDRAVEDRKLREDLLHRLRVVELAVPPLRDRRDDVAPLARAMAERVRQRHGAPHLALSPSALGALEASAWPGNVRQLENSIERAAVNARLAGRATIEPVDLFPERASVEAHTLEEHLHHHRGRIVRAVLEETGWNVREAAARLDVARSYLYKLITLHGLTRPTE